MKGSTSMDYLRNHNIEAMAFTNVEEALRAIQQGSADAVVYDAPVLLYYASHQGKGKMQVVGNIFRKRELRRYLFPSNSPLSETGQRSATENQRKRHLRSALWKMVCRHTRHEDSINSRISGLDRRTGLDKAQGLMTYEIGSDRRSSLCHSKATQSSMVTDM